MSDNFEKFMKENQGAFDQRDPRAQVWQKISAKLPATAAPRPTGKVFLAGVFLVAAVVMTVFVMFGGEKNVTPIGSSAQTLPKHIEMAGYKDFIQPPLEGLNVPYQNYEVSAAEGGYFEMPTGTRVSIPEKAFVDAQGKPVEGKVEIKAREFHNVSEVIASGIPMKFDDNGVLRDFQTAGMIDLRGESSGSEVFIAEGKQLEVNMASFATEKDYNLYFLDPVSKKWLEIGQPENAVNEEKQKQIAALPELPSEPTKPGINDTSSAAPDRKSQVAGWYDSEGKFHTDNPEVKLKQNNFKNEFEFAVDYQQFPELKAFKKIKWKATDENQLANNQWIFNQVWSDVKLVENDKSKRQYTLEMKSDKKSYSMVVTPVLSGKDLNKAYADYEAARNQFEIALRKREQELERIEAEADLFRTFSVSNFGVYNCDRYYNAGPNAVVVASTLNLGEELYRNGLQTTVYHCTGDSRALITYTYTQDFSLTFNPGEDNALLVVLPGNRIAVFSNEDFKKLDFQKLRREKKHEFKFRVLNGKLDSPADLRNIIYAVAPANNQDNNN